MLDDQPEHNRLHSQGCVMARMTVGDANAVNTVLRWFGVPSPVGRPSDEQALHALLLLRGTAFSTLMAGPTEDEVQAAFQAAADRLRQWTR